MTSQVDQIAAKAGKDNVEGASKRMIATGLRQSTQAKGHVPMLITGRKAVMASDIGLESLVSVKVKDQQQCRFELAASDQDSKKNEVKEHSVRLPCVGRARYAEDCVLSTYRPQTGSVSGISVLQASVRRSMLFHVPNTYQNGGPNRMVYLVQCAALVSCPSTCCTCNTCSKVADSRTD